MSNIFLKIHTYLKRKNSKSEKKKQFLIFFILASFNINSYSQNNDTYHTFSSVICEYSIPQSRSGLSVTSFYVTPSIKIERWEKNAQIILNIKQEQGTSSNPNPSYIHSYNFMGTKYGNQALGIEPFEPIRASGITYEVLVTYGSQSWGWKKVDGYGNSFGQIDKNAKASEVMVNVRVVGIQSFSGTNLIENKIRELLKPKDGNTNSNSGSSGNPMYGTSSNQSNNSNSNSSSSSTNKNQISGGLSNKSSSNNNNTTNSINQNNTNNSIPKTNPIPEKIPDSYTGNPLHYNNPNISSGSTALDDFSKGLQQGAEIVNLVSGIVDLFAPTPAQLQKRAAAEAAEAAAIAEATKRAEIAAELRAEKARLIAARKIFVSKLPNGKTPLSYQEKEAKEVYFFTYSYQTTALEEAAPLIFISNVFTVVKYGDGTWPFKSNLINNIAKTNKGLDLILSDYYISKTIAEEQQQLFVRAANSYNFSVQPITYISKITTANSDSNTDFWGNPTKGGTKQSPNTTEKKSATTTPKAKFDYWGNPIKE